MYSGSLREESRHAQQRWRHQTVHEKVREVKTDDERVTYDMGDRRCLVVQCTVAVTCSKLSLILTGIVLSEKEGVSLRS